MILRQCMRFLRLDRLRLVVNTHRGCSGNKDPPEVPGGQDILHDLLSEEPLCLRVDQIGQDELHMMDSQAEGIQTLQGRPPVDHLTTSGQKTRKARSEHYFPKLKKAARASTLDELKVETVIRCYMSRGHLASLIDPLNIVRQPMFRPEFPSRTVLLQHRVPVDRDTLCLLPNDTALGNGFYRMKLGELMKRLNAAYCSTIGAEFIHLTNHEARNWIRERIETIELRFMAKDQKRYCARKLIEIEVFSEFAQHKAGPQQRYSIAGSETSPLGVDILVQRAAKKHGARVFVMGMRRLARFSVITNVLGVNPTHTFNLFNSPMGDMSEKFNLGITSESPSEFVNGINLRYVMVSSPSIPESFYPVVLGVTKGIQDREQDFDGEKVWPIIIHMARGLNSQGIIYETLKLSLLPEFNTHGTIHLVFNNQMEQTLRRETHMTSEYCTDALRTINAPIFHVNGDDLTAVHFTLRMAADYRAKFNRDVIVDIVSYSRAMVNRTVTKYELVRVQQSIRQTRPILDVFLEKLKKENVVTQYEIDHWKKDIEHLLANKWHSVLVSTAKLDMDVWTSQMYMDKVKQMENTRTIDFDTGIKRDILEQICSKVSFEPHHIQISPKHSALLHKRSNLIQKDTLDWILCEALAYGSLLLEQKNVRISGMDVNRRFHILQEDKVDGEEYNLLNNIADVQGRYTLCQSTTSQYATAGFEYGYSTVHFDTLVIWEAPEGDKTSKAQVIIDNYIAGGYVKYNLHSNVVYFLPHYLKCESPSRVCNGRPERFLQLANNYEYPIEMNEDKQMKKTNMIIANVSTPANFFHILRRQMYLPYRRPLMIFTPDLLVPHPDSSSKLDDLSVGTRFQPYIPDTEVNPVSAEKVLLCTGKIYYDLKEERARRGLQEKIAISRIEQLCPLPYKMITEDTRRYITAPIVWVQEEPINQGWWNYIEPRLLSLPNFVRIDCVARPARADGGSRSVATCYAEQMQLYKKAFTINE